MSKLVLTYIGEDDWSRPTYEDESGKIFKDVNCGSGEIHLCTAYGFDGEPDTPIEHIEKYQGVEIEIIEEERLTPEEKFRYRMLSRLQQDCNYFLGNGNRSEKHLWADSVKEHITEMKKLYNRLSDDKKPEWLTWDDILEYEEKMLTND